MDFAMLANFGVLAAVLQIVGYLVYIRYFLKHSIKPNAASFFMFAYGTSLLAFMEWQNGATWSVLLLPTVCAVMSIIVAIMCIPRGATEKIDRVEAVAFSVDLWLTIIYAALVMGFGSGSQYSSWFLLATNLTAVTCFVPVIRSTWIAPDRELPAPWLVWTFAYGALAIATFQTSGTAHPMLLVYPILNMVLHGILGIFALRRGSEDRVYIDKRRTLYFANSAIHGRGVHAGQGFSTGDVIWKMSGRPVFHSSAHGEPNYVGISPNVWIDPDPPIDTMNHSCAPNAAFGRNFELVALRAIHSHDEITFDYSTTEADPEWAMLCGCGVETCREELRAIHIAFAHSRFSPAASPVMQQVWRTQRGAAAMRSAFPQFSKDGVGAATVHELSTALENGAPVIKRA